jgi:arsenate reductase
MAEALLRQLSHDRVDVSSAGSDPAKQLHPFAKEILERKYQIDTSALRPKPMRDFLGERFDFVITVCDKAAESCPVFPGDPERIHWSFEDPVLIEDDVARKRAFESVANGLASRLRIWMSLPDVRRRFDAM